MSVWRCVRGEFLTQGFDSHSLVVVNNVVLKICEVLPSGITKSHCTWIKLCPTSPHCLVGYFRIFYIATYFHFFFCILRQLRCFVVIMNTTRGPNSYSICSSPNLNSCDQMKPKEKVSGPCPLSPRPNLTLSVDPSIEHPSSGPSCLGILILVPLTR